jgi:hypothetical protein
MYYPGICQEGLNKPMKTLSHDNWFPDWDLNWACPECSLDQAVWYSTFPCLVYQCCFFLFGCVCTRSATKPRCNFLEHTVSHVYTTVITELTPGNTHSLEKPLIAQPLKNFPVFYGTQRFITMFTGTYPEPNQSNPIQSIHYPIQSL